MSEPEDSSHHPGGDAAATSGVGDQSTHGTTAEQAAQAGVAVARTDTDRLLISIIAPAFNEEQNMPILRERLTAVMAGLGEYAFEVIIVDDHSSDATPRLVREWAACDPRVRLVRLSRNFGSYPALDAGLRESSGDAAVLMAADLQDPPELVADLAAKWREGTDIVWAVRTEREGESACTKLCSRIYYSVMRRLALPQMPKKGADFLLMDRKVIDAYLAIAEKNVNFVCLLFWMGFRQTFVPYVKRARAAGTSKWTLRAKVKLFVDSVVSFSHAPIGFITLMGALFLLAGVAFAGYACVAWLAGLQGLRPDYSALMATLLAGFGLLMLMLGIVGEYVWRALDEARRRPRFIVEERYPPAETRKDPAGSTCGRESAGVEGTQDAAAT